MSSLLDMAKKTHQLRLNLCDPDEAWLPTFQGRCGHGKLWVHSGSWSPEPPSEDSPSSHKGMELDLIRQNTASSMWPGKFLTVPNSDGELFTFTDSWEEQRQFKAFVFVVAICIFSSAACRRRLRSEPMTSRA